jgi:hypothetical protein
MVTVPALIPVTTPALETVAIAVLDEVQGVVACGLAEPVKVDVLPTQATKVPVIVGSSFTVKLAVVIQSFVLRYVSVTVPTLTPVTTPVLETVAIAVLEEVQGDVACAIAEPVNVVVLPTQTFKVPLIVGNALTVKLTVWVQLFVLR